MNLDDAALRRAYGEALEARARAGAPEPDVPVEALVRLVEGEGPEEERLATLDAAMSDPRTAGELELLRAAAAGAGATGMEAGSPAERGSPAQLGSPAEADGDGPGSRHGGRPPRRWRAARSPLAWAAVLVLALGVGVVWMQSRPGAGTLRSGADALELVSPSAGERVGPRPRFAWRSVSGAVGYSLEVLTVEGDVALQAETGDTVWASAGEDLAPGDYRWWVTARLPSGLRSRAEPRAFTVRSP